MSTFLVERTTTISASPEKIHELIDNFRNWKSWSPWEGADPDLQRSYAGPERGVGSSYAWVGNRKAGAGSMTITDSKPGQIVKLDLVFTKPFKATNVTTFTIDPGPNGSEVTWAMTGENNLFFRLLGKVFPMDKVVGKDFEKGLAQLKAQAESSS
ncbi:SRPBCC family protein [Rhodococcus sp. BP-252]|uniref:Transcriptional regulator n=1 Tax=Rhodococcoides kyotonense TaxID=398843 RepID=A0A177YBB3_9NOCA|nr:MULTISPECIES: SRPBCC family protein [Rhodococcus]MBY6411697.1 SRPBCC family protein [Rhodococcus sp. BP-320]MBY6417318.1 SRPBCC family protein [Rhodococcus sp. BP-321]MBY6421897.1 SRPBCC family protein [Rhodococcus sp. BP-324]MBY6427342.1 SRPBCC family protein [Rhodococcus sp. BP-323]MBY6432515.1 SRPBCC family protein [Rhodococcus sp. BP-322]